MGNRILIRRDQLRRLRNEIDFRRLFDRLRWPWKLRADGVILFVCPRCNERQTSVHPKHNLARCFRCQANWNPIDFVMQTTPMDFLTTVGYLEDMLPDDEEGQ